MRILLAYSGDVTTTAAIPWLRDTYGAEVITATIDLGQERELEAVRDRAIAAGAIRAHVVDGRDQFARDFVLPSLKADALDDRQFVLAAALSRPLIARTLVEIAASEQVDAVAHGASRRNATPAVLDVLIRSLNAELQIITVPSSPPHELVAYARAQGAPPAVATRQANLWGSSIAYPLASQNGRTNMASSRDSWHDARSLSQPAAGEHVLLAPLGRLSQGSISLGHISLGSISHGGVQQSSASTQGSAAYATAAYATASSATASSATASSATSPCATSPCATVSAEKTTAAVMTALMPADLMSTEIMLPEITPGAARRAARCPNEPARVDIAFDHGIPKSINGVFMPLVELIASLGTIAAAHGVGRVAADGRLCEAPAAMLLHAAHRQLQAEATSGELEAFARAVSLKYVELVCDGLWFTPLREALDAFVDKVQERVTGEIRLELFKGNVVAH